MQRLLSESSHEADGLRLGTGSAHRSLKSGSPGDREGVSRIRPEKLNAQPLVGSLRSSRLQAVFGSELSNDAKIGLMHAGQHRRTLSTGSLE